MMMMMMIVIITISLLVKMLEIYYYYNMHIHADTDRLLACNAREEYNETKRKEKYGRLYVNKSGNYHISIIIIVERKR